MSQNDVCAARERYRANAYQPGHFGEEDYRKVGYLTSHEGWEDRVKLSNAFIAEHPADDDTLINMDFVRGSGLQESSRSFQNQKFFTLTCGTYLQADACAGPKCWEWSLITDQTSICRNPTRGRLRKLCSALDISLTEPRATEEVQS